MPGFPARDTKGGRGVLGSLPTLFYNTRFFFYEKTAQICCVLLSFWDLFQKLSKILAEIRYIL